MVAYRDLPDSEGIEMPNPRVLARYDGAHYDSDRAWAVKKALRRPEATVKMAVESYPEWVVHSEGHVSRNAARTTQKYIRGRKGMWSDYYEYNLKVEVFPDFPEDHEKDPDGYTGTWCVAVAVEFPIDRGAL